MAADFESSTNQFFEDFDNYAQKMFKGSNVAIDAFLDSMKKIAKHNQMYLKDYVKQGRWTSDVIEKLREEIEELEETAAEWGETLDDGFKAQKKMLKSLEDVQEMSDKLTDSLSESVKSITHHIPIVGHKIAEAFDTKVIPKLTKRLDAGFMRLLNKGGKGSGAGGFSAGKFAAFGIIAVAIAGIVEAFTEAERSITGLIQQTGFLRKDVHKVSHDMEEAHLNVLKFGISMDDVRESTAALLEEFGSLGFVNQELIENSAKWSKAYNISAKEIAQTVDVLHRALGMTNKEVDEFVKSLDTDARIAGVSVSMVMNDVMGDANFLALYTKRSGKNLKDAAIEARKMGVSLSATQKIAEKFLDYDSALDGASQLNLLVGTKLNPMELHRLAITGQITELHNKILDAVSKENKWDNMLVNQRQAIAAAMGVSAEEAAKMLKSRQEEQKLSPKELADRKKELESQENLNKLLMDQQTAWAKVWNTLKSKIHPIFSRIGLWLSDVIAPLADKISAMIEKWFPDTGKMTSVWDTMKRIWNGLKGLVGDVFKETLEKAFDYISENYQFNAGAILSGGPIISRNVSNMTTADLYTEISKIASGKGGNAEALGEVGRRFNISGDVGYQAAMDAVTKQLRIERGETRKADFEAASKSFDKIVAENKKKLEDEKKKKPQLAKGGIVTKPTRALIGEAGPEAVIPLGNNSIDHSSGGGLKFARGGLILPLDQSRAAGSIASNLSNQGSMMAAGDPNAISMRTKEFQREADAQRQKMVREQNAMYKRDLALQQYRNRDTNMFSSGISSFSSGISSFMSSIQTLTGIDVYGQMKDAFMDLIPPEWSALADNLKTKFDGFMQSLPGQMALGMYQGFQQGGMIGGARGGAGALANHQFKDGETFTDKVDNSVGRFVARKTENSSFGTAAGAAAGAGIGAGLNTFAQGGSGKQALSSALSAGSMAGFAAGGPGGIALGIGLLAGDLLLKGGKKRGERRQRLIENIAKGLDKGSVSKIKPGANLFSSIGADDGRLFGRGRYDKGSYALTINAIASSFNLQPKEAEALFNYLVGNKKDKKMEEYFNNRFFGGSGPSEELTGSSKEYTDNITKIQTDRANLAAKQSSWRNISADQPAGVAVDSTVTTDGEGIDTESYSTTYDSGALQQFQGDPALLAAINQMNANLIAAMNRPITVRMDSVKLGEILEDRARR